jgi:RHS repeat-associated protein
VIEERDGSDNVLKQYIYGNGIDELIRVDINESGNFTPYYFHTNGIGSVTAITDQDGELVERVSYDLYGMPTFTDYRTDLQNPQVVGSSVIDNELLFQGRRYEKETNLIYFRARYYDPIMGRFLQTDPMGYQDSMNLYQAFNMNPVNFIDSMGMEVKDIILIIKGPNEIKSAELGKVKILGPQNKYGYFVFAVNIVVTFTEDDNPENYIAKQTAFYVFPNKTNEDKTRPGTPRTIMKDDPDKKMVTRAKDKLIWYDNPGFKVQGVLPATVSGAYFAVFTSTVVPIDKTNGTNTNKILYWAVQLIVKNGKIVVAKAGKVSRTFYYQVIEKYKGK